MRREGSWSQVVEQKTYSEIIDRQEDISSLPTSVYWALQTKNVT